MWTQLLGRLSWATEASFLILENYTDLPQDFPLLYSSPL